MSLQLATQITAFGTAVLAVGAIVTAVFAFLAFRAQAEVVAALQRQAMDQTEELDLQRQQLDEQRKLSEKQAEVLELQAGELRDSFSERVREAGERRRAQAAQVFIRITGAVTEGQWTLPPERHVILVEVRGENTSALPVYDITAQSYTSDGSFGSPFCEPVLMPGKDFEISTPWTPGLSPTGLGVTMEFRDAAGVHWRTNDRGMLTELCGVPSPALHAARCTHTPDHEGLHSWD